MDAPQLMLVLLPAFIILFVIIPSENRVGLSAVKKRNTKGIFTMTNELIQRYIGHTCTVSTGAFGQSVNGEITSVVENWIEVKTKKGTQLLNSDYVTNIISNQK